MQNGVWCNALQLWAEKEQWQALVTGREKESESETIAGSDWLEGTVCRCDQCLFNIVIVPPLKTCCKYSFKFGGEMAGKSVIDLIKTVRCKKSKLSSQTYQFKAVHCWHIMAFVSVTSQSSLFWSSLIKSRPMWLHPKSSNWSSKTHLLHNYWQNTKPAYGRKHVYIFRPVCILGSVPL